MKLRPILKADAPVAATLLAEGFPVHSRTRWQDYVRRLFAHVEHMGGDSIGHIGSVGGHDIGIGLAIPGTRGAYEASMRPVVNLAAFYLRPGNEWVTTLFLRRMMKDPSIEYVDLTASPQMREVNRLLGFTDRTRGIVIVSTALAAMLPGPHVRIIPFRELPLDAMSPDHRDILAQHDRLQAISLAAEVDDTCHPLILVKGCRKRMKSARIVLARDRDLVRAIAGPLSRHLLRRGFHFFEFESLAPVRLPGAVFSTRVAPVQTTWPVESAVIDDTFSELMFIPPPDSRPLLALPRWRSGPAFPFPFGLVDASITATPTATFALNLVEMLPV